MPKPRHRKDHKKKVAARNEKIKNEKKRIEKMKRDFIMNIIKQEQEKGLFENTPTINNESDHPTIDGPSI